MPARVDLLDIVLEHPQPDLRAVGRRQDAVEARTARHQVRATTQAHQEGVVARTAYQDIVLPPAVDRVRARGARDGVGTASTLDPLDPHQVGGAEVQEVFADVASNRDPEMPARVDLLDIVLEHPQPDLRAVGRRQDAVEARAPRHQVRATAESHKEGVVARVAYQDVVLTPAGDCVGTGTAIERISPGAAIDHVGTALAKYSIVPAQSGDRIRPLVTDEGLTRLGAGQHKANKGTGR